MEDFNVFSGFDGCAGTGGHNVPLHSPDKKDRLTIEELEKKMGMVPGFTEGVANSRRLEMIGNGFQIDTLTHILKGIENK